MSALQWEDALYLDWIHSLKGNSKLFKLVLLVKSFSLVVLEKDFFHKRKFSKLLLQLVVLCCPHKDAAYIEERESRTTTPRPHPQNCSYVAGRGDEMILEKLSPRTEKGCAARRALCQQVPVPRPASAHGQHEQLFNHFKLKCRLRPGVNRSFWQLGKNVGLVGERDINSGKDWSNQQKELTLLKNCQFLTIIPGHVCWFTIKWLRWQVPRK